MSRSWVAVLVVTALALMAGGCTGVKETFPGYQPEQVWQALIAAAETPMYESDENPDDRWNVRENRVHVAPEEQRIDIYRELIRYRYGPEVRGGREDRTWRIAVSFDPGEPPSATLRAMQATAPPWVWEEGQRYFRSVWQHLPAAPTPAEVISEELIDALGTD